MANIRDIRQTKVKESKDMGPDNTTPSEADIRAHIIDICGKLDVPAPEGAPSEPDGISNSETKYTRAVRWLAVRTAAFGSQLCDWASISGLALSSLAMLMFASSALLILSEAFVWAAAVLAVGGLLESVDGAVATRSAFSKRDVFVDYLFDRFGDVFILGALVASFWGTNSPIAGLAAATLLVSLMASFARAQAEALRFEPSSRFGRLERLTLTFMALCALAVESWVGGNIGTAIATAALGGALVVSTVALAERVFSVVRSRNDLHLSMAQWDDESLLPRIIHDLVQSEEFGVAVVENEERLDGRRGGRRVIHIDRGSDGTTRVRIARTSSVTSRIPWLSKWHSAA